jgi:hypothetical protein
MVGLDNMNGLESRNLYAHDYENACSTFTNATFNTESHVQRAADNVNG